MISCVLSQFSHRLCSPLVQPSKDRGKVVSDLVWEKQSEDLGPDLPWKSLPLLFEFIGVRGSPGAGWFGLSAGIDPTYRGPASLEQSLSLLGQRPKRLYRALQGLTCD